VTGDRTPCTANLPHTTSNTANTLCLIHWSHCLHAESSCRSELTPTKETGHLIPKCQWWVDQYSYVVPKARTWISRIWFHFASSEKTRCMSPNTWYNWMKSSASGLEWESAGHRTPQMFKNMSFCMCLENEVSERQTGCSTLNTNSNKILIRVLWHRYKCGGHGVFRIVKIIRFWLLREVEWSEPPEQQTCCNSLSFALNNIKIQKLRIPHAESIAPSVFKKLM